MPRQRDALTELVQQHVGQGRRWSTRAFAEVAVDPVSGWSPSKSLIGKIIKPLPYEITPALVSALAVGLELPREVVAAAAHYQVIGYTDSELSADATARIVHEIGLRPASTVKSQALADRWDAEDG